MCPLFAGADAFLKSQIHLTRRNGMCNAFPCTGRIKGLRSLGSTGEFSMGFSLKQQKPLDLSRGGHGPETFVVVA